MLHAITGRPRRQVPKSKLGATHLSAKCESHTRMNPSDEAEIAVVGTKGQIVIPQEMRRQLAIGPKTKLAIYRRDDKLIVTKISLPAISGEIDAVLKEIDSQRGRRKTVDEN